MKKSKHKKPENMPKNETQTSSQTKDYFHGTRHNANPWNWFAIIAWHPAQIFASFYFNKHPSNGLVKNKDGHRVWKYFPTIDALANFEITCKINDDCKIKAIGFFVLLKCMLRMQKMQLLIEKIKKEQVFSR